MRCTLCWNIHLIKRCIPQLTDKTDISLLLLYWPVIWEAKLHKWRYYHLPASPYWGDVEDFTVVRNWRCWKTFRLKSLLVDSYFATWLRIISRGVSGLATDSPCGVWGRGWTTCFLHDSPLFGSQFKIFIYLLIFLASVHGFMHETRYIFNL